MVIYREIETVWLSLKHVIREGNINEQLRWIKKAQTAFDVLFKIYHRMPCGDDGGGDGGGGTTPTADFTFLPPQPVTGETIDFSATHSGLAGTPTTSWSFGDGATGVGATTTHAYPSAGTWPVTVTVNDGTNQVTGTHDVVVHAPACDVIPTAHVLSNQDPLLDPFAIQIELFGNCFEWNRAGAAFGVATAPAGKPWNSYNVRTDGNCGAPALPTFTLKSQFMMSSSVGK